MDDVKIDVAKEIPDWDAIQLVENRALVEELV